MAGPGAADTGAPSSPGFAWYTVAVVVFLVILSYVDRASLALFAHPIQQQLGVTDSQMGVLFGLGLIVPLALATLGVGWIIDRFGSVGVIVAGVLIWSIAAVLCGIAGSFGALLTARGLLGLGEASIGPAGYALAAERFPPDLRGRAVGVIAASVSVGTGAGLIVGGLMLRALGNGSYAVPGLGWLQPWQMAYVILGAIGLPAALLVLTLRRPRGVRASAGAMPVDWSFLVGRRGLFAAILLCAALNVAVGTGVVSWAPTLLGRRFGMEPSSAGYLLGLMSVVGGLSGPPLAAELSDHWTRTGRRGGRLRGHPAFFLLIALGTVLLVAAGNTKLAAAGLLFVTFSLGALNAVSYAAVTDLTPQPMIGRMMAALQFLSLACGYAVGPSLVAAFTDHVFHDRGMIGAALLAAALPIAAAGAAIAWAGGRSYPIERSTKGNTA